VPVDGFDCWQVAFAPKTDVGNSSDIDDAILNHISGIAYVDARTFLIRSIHGKITKPFRWGFLNAGHILEITLDAQQAEWDDQRHIGIQTTSVVRVHYRVLSDTFLRVEYLHTNHAWQP